MLKYLVILAPLIIRIKSQNNKYLPSGFWVIENTRISRVIRMSLKNQEGLRISSAEEKSKYVIENFLNKNNLVQYFSGTTPESEVTSKYSNNIANNEALTKIGSITVNSRPKESVDFLSGQMTIKGISYQEWKSGSQASGGTTPSLIEKANEGDTEIIEFNAQWITEADWKQNFYIIWSIFKGVMNIIMIYVTFARPFMEEYKKLRAIWIGQSVMYYQLFMYSGLTVGVFGGLIDDIQEGIIKASRRWFMFIPSNPGFSEEKGFVIYKFYQNDLIPLVLEEAFLESILVLGTTLIYFIAKFYFSEKTLKIIREIKSSIYLFCMLPLFVHTMHTFIVHSLLRDRTFYIILNLLVGIMIFVIYLVKLIYMADTIRQINYLHSRGAYQEGKVDYEQGSDLAFDTYVSMDTNVKLRVLEFLTYLFIFFIWAIGYLAASATATLTFLYYVFLAYAAWQKFSNFKLGTIERKYQKRVLLMSLFHTILISIQHFIFLLFWWMKNIKVSTVKILTYFYFFFAFADIVVISVQIGARFRRLDIHSARDGKKKKNQEGSRSSKKYEKDWESSSMQNNDYLINRVNNPRVAKNQLTKKKDSVPLPSSML